MSGKHEGQETLKELLQQQLYPHPGEIWRHYKGGEYEVIALAVDEATGEPVVVYRSLTLGYVWVRELRVWMERVNAPAEPSGHFYVKPRFERNHEHHNTGRDSTGRPRNDAGTDQGAPR